ncbi:uncharacterized protein KNAG_0C06210 [Huiozyma naganishii CBS 8797]|uniref:BZIP domain-containing protein n=1 Tax=Huiozyma naganishii (strain ATCC MYA-139 / BCRC 22969 / CBS 8797 / KCTC 17520 / NBRC 10181 / NCYC 3082 / Yp74L-3) TaxID=1071383 RepID=J7RXB6_HUIN7|nr:hypothetical protein KNAG_0C06210 [Kazachstania naganishii CBS 8797]CCK69717.1 hypothetical protein KNAG_0C06210 [Kazachstania naganishii CBS 8797]
MSDNDVNSNSNNDQTHSTDTATAEQLKKNPMNIRDLSNPLDEYRGQVQDHIAVQRSTNRLVDGLGNENWDRTNDNINANSPHDTNDNNNNSIIYLSHKNAVGAFPGNHGIQCAPPGVQSQPTFAYPQHLLHVQPAGNNPGINQQAQMPLYPGPMFPVVTRIPTPLRPAAAQTRMGFPGTMQPPVTTTASRINPGTVTLQNSPTGPSHDTNLHETTTTTTEPNNSIYSSSPMALPPPLAPAGTFIQRPMVWLPPQQQPVGAPPPPPPNEEDESDEERKAQYPPLSHLYGMAQYNHISKNLKSLRDSKRAVQNRNAQKAFRLRKEKYMRLLEDKAMKYEQLYREHEALQREILNLRNRIYQLEQQLRAVTGNCNNVAPSAPP